MDRDEGQKAVQRLTERFRRLDTRGYPELEALLAIARVRILRDGQREGQALWNAASIGLGVPIAKYAGSAYDPFHDDELIDRFLNLVMELLTDPAQRWEH